MRIFPELPSLPVPPRRKPGVHAAFMPQVSRAFSWAALATALAGCDGNGSVTHSAHLDAKPDMLCMQQTLRKVPGVSEVHYVHEEAANKQPYDEFDYQVDDQYIMLMVQFDYIYKQVFLRIGPLRADPQTAQVRRVMAEVDSAVAKSCHLPQLAHEVRETCGDAAYPDGVCPPLVP